MAHYAVMLCVSRKEKAEIEALTATIEKMKIDHDGVVKRLKVNESRWVPPALLQLIDV